ncbi:MAG: alpha/beta hydrolase [Gammaproteobacteria bacterium]|nr:alpha/beta hydrolase [Gammaproteobacteria bacterium]
MSNENPVVIDTGNNPKACVIWLHGLGADGHDFEPIVPELRIPAATPVRFVFPHAPRRPVTVNGGMVMRAWYDMFMTDNGLKGSDDDVRESQAWLTQFIDQQCQQGFRPEQVILAGFSQGGAIVLHTGLGFAPRVGGIMALSTYVPIPELLESGLPHDPPPVFMAHGRQDGVLPFGFAALSRDKMQQAGVNVEWHEYDMAHSVCGEEISHIRQWLLARLDEMSSV